MRSSHSLKIGFLAFLALSVAPKGGWGAETFACWYWHATTGACVFHQMPPDVQAGGNSTAWDNAVTRCNQKHGKVVINTIPCLGMGYHEMSPSEWTRFTDSQKTARKRLQALYGKIGTAYKTDQRLDSKTSAALKRFLGYQPDAQGRYRLDDLAKIEFILMKASSRIKGWDSLTTLRASKQLQTNEGHPIAASMNANKSEFVTLYDAYFNKSLTAPYNSSWGTLVHEAMHSKFVHDCDDHRYGVEACTTLTKYAPLMARKNADNWKYFVEFASQ